MTMKIPALSALQFHTQLQRLTDHENTAQAEFLIWLAEFDRRDLYLALGYASLWSYCLDGLHYDEGQVNLRTRTAHLLQRFPALVEPLRGHRLSMSTIVVLGRVIDESNAAELIEKASHKTKTEVETLVVSIRPIEVKQEGFRVMNQPLAPAHVSAAVVAEDWPPVGTSPPAPRPLQPVAVDATLFRAKLSNETVDALKRAAELASHRIKAGDWNALLAEMVRVFCEHELKRVASKTDRPREPSKQPKNNKNVPRAVRSVVWDRDGGCCAFIGADGRRCGSRWRVQYHHVHPAGQGGPATVENIALRCARHNQYEADLVYGKGFMDARRNPTTPGRGDLDHEGPCVEAG
jgi:hypothetical protein